MGNFGSAIARGVKWIGGCICKVVGWFFEFLEEVSGKVKSFLYDIEDIIKGADNPKDFGECAAIKKEMNELDQIAKEKYKNLSSNDKQKMDQLFAKRDY